LREVSSENQPRGLEQKPHEKDEGRANEKDGERDQAHDEHAQEEIANDGDGPG